MHCRMIESMIESIQLFMPEALTLVKCCSVILAGADRVPFKDPRIDRDIIRLSRKLKRQF